MIFDGLPPISQLPTALGVHNVPSSRFPAYNHPTATTTVATNPFHSKRPTIYIGRLPAIARGVNAVHSTNPQNGRPITLIRRRDQLFVNKLSLRSLLPPNSHAVQPAVPSQFHQQPQYFPQSNTLDSLDVGAVQEVFSCPASTPISPSFSSLSTNTATRHQQNAAPNQHSLPLLPDIMEPEFHQLGVRIQHLNIRIKDAIVTNPNGCCIYYGRYDDMIAPPVTSSPPIGATTTTSAPDPIEMSIGHNVAEANRAYVDMLLNHMVRGITVTASSHDGSIYVERLCRCAVFVYYLDEATGEYVFVKKVVRRECAKVFDYAQFAEELEYFRLGQGPKPHYEVVLAFGQQLRPGLATYNLLVWCRVASCRAWFQFQRVGFLLLVDELSIVCKLNKYDFFQLLGFLRSQGVPRLP